MIIRPYIFLCRLPRRIMIRPLHPYHFLPDAAFQAPFPFAIVLHQLHLRLRIVRTCARESAVRELPGGLVVLIPYPLQQRQGILLQIFIPEKTGMTEPQRHYRIDDQQIRRGCTHSRSMFYRGLPQLVMRFPIAVRHHRKPLPQLGIWRGQHPVTLQFTRLKQQLRKLRQPHRREVLWP